MNNDSQSASLDHSALGQVSGRNLRLGNKFRRTSLSGLLALLPVLTDEVEQWHALLLPTMHHEDVMWRHTEERPGEADQGGPSANK